MPVQETSRTVARISSRMISRWQKRYFQRDLHGSGGFPLYLRE